MDKLAEFNKTMADESRKIFPGKTVVFGNGKINADIMLIGEAPGGEEEKIGRPFVGKAGKNLSEFLQKIGLDREKIYISNVVKIRPVKLSPKTGKPVNRPPNRDELNFFVPYLHNEIELVSPNIIVTLGNFSLKYVLMEKDRVIGDCHGQIIKKNGFEVFPLYHPASIIYNRALKDVYDNDLKILKETLADLKTE